MSRMIKFPPYLKSTRILTGSGDEVGLKRKYDKTRAVFKSWVGAVS